ncbi:MAG: hypothetical protein ABR936_17395 [Bacteroidota bacterium]|jgi:hypothetical protein
MATNMFSIHLKFISIAFKYDILIEALFHIRNMVDNLNTRTIQITQGLDPDNAEGIREDTNTIIENMHGAAFVCCQASINGVASRIKTFHAFAKNEGITLTSVPEERKLIIASHCPVVPSTTVSQIQAIDTLANYFKHRDQWPHGWINPDGQSRLTIQTLQTLGFTPYQDDILNSGISMFGPNILNLANVLNKWVDTLVDELEKELKTLGKI